MYVYEYRVAPGFLKAALLHPDEFEEFIDFLDTRGEEFGNDFQSINDEEFYDDHLPPVFMKQLECNELEALEFVKSEDVVEFLQNITWGGRAWKISESTKEVVVPTNQFFTFGYVSFQKFMI